MVLSASNDQMTSSAVIGLPSWNRAWRLSVYATHERSAGTSTVSATSPYSENASSLDWTVRVSKIPPMPAAGTPFRMNGLSVSNVPSAASLTLPPFAAAGLA